MLNSDLGIDATYHIPGADIAASGYKFVGRYDLSGAYRVTPDEIADYHANGLSVLFFGEHASDFMLGGAAAGVEAGKDAHDYLQSLGAPAGIAEFFTCDFDAQPSQFPKIGAFLSGADSELYPYKAGIYGGIHVTDAFPGYPSFQSAAWSGGVVSEHANFYQRIGTTLPPIATDGSYDEDVAINPAGYWAPTAPPPPPTIGENEMWRFIIWGVSGKNILVDAQNEKPLKTFADATGPYGLTPDAARFLSAYAGAATFDVIDPAAFAKAYPGYVV